MLTQARLKEVLKYDRKTGLFTRRVANRTKPKGHVYGHHHNAYVSISVDGRSYSAHRLAWLYVYGYFPKRPLELDHIDRRKNNNAIKNLREVTRSENAKNRAARTHRKRRDPAADAIRAGRPL